MNSVTHGKGHRMDKISSSNPQNRPVWERRTSRGHRSAVKGALEAHRQRTSERQSRVQARLDREQGVSNGFFPNQSSNIMNRAQQMLDSNAAGKQNVTGGMRNPMGPNANVANSPQPVPASADISPVMIAQTEEVPAFNPMSMDEIYNDLQMSSSTDSAQILVDKDITNPEEGPMDDVPKGSYVDYMV